MTSYLKLFTIAALTAILGVGHVQVSADNYTSEQVAQAPQKAYRPGQILRPSYRAEANQKLTFELRGVATGLLLKETRPGQYSGELMLLPSMAPYEGELLVKEFSSGKILSSKPVRIQAGPVLEIQASTSDDELHFAFDETIRAHTVAVKVGEKTLNFPEDIEISSNYFSCDVPNSNSVDIEAQTIDGRLLKRNVRVDSISENR